MGAKRDPRFGAIVLVGLGGVYAEILDDVTVALAPVDDSTAERLIRALRGAPLLDGARGRSRLDIAAAAHAVAAMSRAAAACPEILEIEVNPLFVADSGAVGLDARIVLALRTPASLPRTTITHRRRGLIVLEAPTGAPARR